MNPSSTPTDSTAATRRGTNYTEDEDVAIMRAYMNVSLDPITGTDQKEGTYYARIWEVYQMKNPRDCVTRPMMSVQTRIKTIVKETVRFAACFRSIETMRKSCLLYTSPSPRDQRGSRMPSSA